MLIERLLLHDFRRFTETEFSPLPGFNLLTGDNGSGKTTILEALHLLAHGRSFRGRVRDGLIRQGAPALQVYTEWVAPDGLRRRAGLQHAGQHWQARLDGADVQQLGQLCEALAVVTFEPGSHALVDGSSEVRRRFLDWGLFHVEQGFMPEWRRYSRALKQRNALLRQRGSLSALDAWEQELAAAGEALTVLRSLHIARLQPHLDALLPRLLPAAGEVALELQPGWRRQDMSLADALLLSRERDLTVGHTTQGPHRAELRLRLRDLPGREALSRGQTKQLALALLLTQASLLAGLQGHWPLLQLDDMGAELDRWHQQRLLEVLQDTGAQVFVTGTDVPSGLQQQALPVTTFHVEHGALHSRVSS